MIPEPIASTLRWLRRLPVVRLLLPLLATLALAGCGYNSPHLSFLNSQGPIANSESWHFYWVLGILAILVAGPIFLVLPWILWHYRYGNKKARYDPKWKYELWIEITTWAGPIAIVIVLGFFVWRDAHRLDPYKPIASSQPTLHLQVIGYDWKWLIIYPQQGIATIGKMALPIGRPVSIHITSATVMQSFFIPALGSQIYAMGGMVTQLNLEASKPGHYLGENTMYNGDGFAKQKFIAMGMSPNGFKAWVKKVHVKGIPLSPQVLNIIAERSTFDQLVAALPKDATHDGTVYLTGVTPKLFREVVKATMKNTRVKPVNGRTTAQVTRAAKPLASTAETDP